MPQATLEPETAEILGLDEALVTSVLERLEDDQLVKRETLHLPD